MRARRPSPGEVVVVTGAANGIGRALARRWAEAGVRIAAWDLDADRLRDLEGEVAMAGTWAVDVGDPEAVQATAEAVREMLGPIEVLVNAAGIAPMGRIGKQPISDLHRTVAVNLLGTANTVHAVVNQMRERGHGTIINFASIAGWITGPAGAGYGASKAAVVSYTEALAAELQRTGVRVFAVCPPTVDTPMLSAIRETGEVPAKAFEFVRPLTADAVADAVERAYGRRTLFVFPGRGTASLIRTVRLSPWLMRRLTRALYGV